MASVVLTSIGRAAGNFLLPGLGGTLVGGLGASLGNIVDAQLGLGTHITGPHLDNLSVQDSRYGAGIPVIYGNARVAGNVIWSTDLIETTHESTSGGKGGGVTTTTYSYSVHCAVGLCLGPIGGIAKIWADTTVIYEDGVWTSGYVNAASIYLGAAGQGVDPFMASLIGSGNVPAYQGLAYVVFENLQLDAFGNRLPSLTFEIITATATISPTWQGSVAPNVSQRSAAMQGGTLAPITLVGSASSAQTILLGGYNATSGSVTFTVVAYDVTGDAPVELYRVTSAAFTTSSQTDCAWALAPDGRFVVLYLLNSSGTHFLALYDTVNKSFGAVTSLALTANATVKQIAWLDAHRFVLDAVSGTVRGLQVFARSGSGVVSLGFTALWGSGSSTTTAPFYGAQFTPYADGLLAYTWVTTVANTLTLQARALSWRANALSVGAAYTVLSSLALGSGSGGHAHFVKTGSGEWTLVYGNVTDYRLVSFEPAATSATVTRAWQTITPSFGTGTTQYPIAFGSRLLILQRSAYESVYRLSEVTLGSSAFTLTTDAATVAGGAASSVTFAGIKLDGARLLLYGTGGFYGYILQCAVIKRNADGALDTIVGDVLARAGYATGDYDLSALSATTIQGYVISDPTSARKAIEPLQAYKPFDLIENDGQLVAVLRGGATSATVGEGEAHAAFAGKEQPPFTLTVRAQEMDLPREVSVDYIDPARNYEVNCQRARRQTTSARTVQKLSLPVVCSAATAKQIAETRLYAAWAERDLVKISLSRAWLALDPSDVITVGGRAWRIAAVTQNGGLVEIEAFSAIAASLSSTASADGGLNVTSAAADAVPTILYLMDLPLLRAADDQPGLYVAASGGAGWSGATLMRAADGVNYSMAASLSEAAVTGIATAVLATAPADYMDNANTVTVQLLQGELASCTWTDLAAGANAALLGDEIIQFQTATLVDTGLYKLSNLLRARRGTEAARATHALGETFVLLQEGKVDFVPAKLSDRAVAYDFRALSSGQNLSDAQDYVFTYALATLRPLAPVQIKGARAAGPGGDLVVTWVRRARRDAEWVDYIDVPLDEDSELYQLDIMSGATVLRSFTGLSAATATYTAAQQTSDWGASVPSSVTVNVYQVSARYGKGVAGTAAI